MSDAARSQYSKMKMLYVALVIATAVFIQPRSALALFDTEQLQAVCQAGLDHPVRDDPKYAFCTGLIVGTLMTDMLEKDAICVPASLDTKTAIQTFVNFAQVERDKKIEGAVTLYRALLATFPCKKR